MAPAQHPALLSSYGMHSLEDFSKPEARKMATVIADAKPGFAIHHRILGHKLNERMDELGIENVYRHTNDKNRHPLHTRCWSG